MKCGDHFLYVGQNSEVPILMVDLKPIQMDTGRRLVLFVMQKRNVQVEINNAKSAPTAEVTPGPKFILRINRTDYKKAERCLPRPLSTPSSSASITKVATNSGGLFFQIFNFSGYDRDMNRESLEKLTVLYERRIAPFAFIAGFIFDIFTLIRVDAIRDHVFLIGHLLISGAGIALVNAGSAGKLRGKFSEIAAWLAPLMIQFSIGALFSGSVILYWRSGSLAGSWPFLGSLAFLLIGNEFFRARYKRFIFHISAYFIALTSYAILALPIALGKMGPEIFVASSLASLAIVSIVMALFTFISPEIIRGHVRNLVITIGGIFVAFNLLYFTNIIPPIPLALKQLEIAHSILRTQEGYELTLEPKSWTRFIPGKQGTYHWVAGTPVFAFSAVFAPTAIQGTIVHHWLYFNPETRSWEEQSVIRFALVGGRDDGYRGYTQKSQIAPGNWRVDVKTERGQLLGRATFTVLEVGEMPPLEIKKF